MDVGLSNILNEGVVASSVSGTGDTSIQLTSVDVFSTTLCSNGTFCSDATPTASSTTLTSGVSWSLIWGAGATFTTNSAWSVVENPAGAFTIQMSGVYSAVGYENTAGTLNLTFQDPAVLVGSRYVFSVSGSGGSGGRVEVPEPATLSLLGAGLLGMGIFGRRRRRYDS
jgi:hypothetical protein